MTGLGQDATVGDGLAAGVGDGLGAVVGVGLGEAVALGDDPQATATSAIATRTANRPDIGVDYVSWATVWLPG